MKISNFNKTPDGFSRFDVLATEQETGILINLALDALISIGYLSMSELENVGSANIDLKLVPESSFYRA